MLKYRSCTSILYLIILTSILFGDRTFAQLSPEISKMITIAILFLNFKVFYLNTSSREFR